MMNSTNLPEASVKTMLWTAVGLGVLAAAKGIYRNLTKYDLQNKVVLITGGSHGLGLAMARSLAKRGAKLAICARTGPQLDRAKAELEAIGAEVLAIQADVTKQLEVERMMRTVINRFDRIDVLINNAGIIMVGPQNVMEVADYQKAMNTNLWAALSTIKEVIPHFRDQGEGRIVNICSIGGKIAIPHLLPYSVSKYALVGLSEGLGAELKKDNIQVTTVIPNLMQTGSPRNVFVKGEHEAEYAWFKIVDSSLRLSQKAHTAAEHIVDALENGKNEVVLSHTAKVAIALQGLMPDTVSSLIQLANRFLTKNTNVRVKGSGFARQLTDRLPNGKKPIGLSEI